MKITLKDIEEFDISVLDKVPSSLEEAYAQVEMKTSLVDTGVPEGLKEVTDYNKISLGHFIILEKLLSMQISGEAKIKLMMPYIVRPDDEKKLDNDDEDKEKKHKDSIYDINLGAAYGIFNRFMQKRHQYLFKDYNGVIYATQSDEDDDEADDEDDGTSVDGGQSAREFHNQKFYWYNLVGTICNDDIFRRQDAIELMMYEVMPFLAEKRSLAIVEQLEAKSRQ